MDEMHSNFVEQHLTVERHQLKQEQRLLPLIGIYLGLALSYFLHLISEMFYNNSTGINYLQHFICTFVVIGFYCLALYSTIKLHKLGLSFFGWSCAFLVFISSVAITYLFTTYVVVMVVSSKSSERRRDLIPLTTFNMMVLSLLVSIAISKAMLAKSAFKLATFVEKNQESSAAKF